MLEGLDPPSMRMDVIVRDVEDVDATVRSCDREEAIITLRPRHFGLYW